MGTCRTATEMSMGQRNAAALAAFFGPIPSRRCQPYLCVVDPNRLAGWAIILTLAFCGAMLLCVEFGRRWALAQLERHGPEARTGVGVVDGAVYGLLALLVGFSFSGA